MLGAKYLGDRCGKFVVWAPQIDRVQVNILDPGEKPWCVCTPAHAGCRILTLEKMARGYHTAMVEDVEPGMRYVFSLDGKERPDPASRFQPCGVHGPSQIFDRDAFGWNDRTWGGLPLDDYLIYEIHVGTFTEQGTFDAIVPHLARLRDLGITAVELMPVAEFPGSRNWGYDGAYPFAAQSSYGGPEGLMRLVDACHQRGLAVVLDVVYNHLGPEGNYLSDFGPYFTDHYRTPWGRAVNFDGPGSDEVVQYFIENAIQWVGDFHIDALRLDAIHGIVDCNAQPFLQLLAESVHEFALQHGRHINLIAESDFNNVRFIRAPEAGGYGLDAQWSDDFHHAVHALLTGEKTGYYRDFGKADHVQKALAEGFVYSGQYSAYRERRHGNSSHDVPPRQLVVFTQNHDQVGNRPFGDRLNSHVSLEAQKLAAGAAILSPYIPLLFMGEEYGEVAPFHYFTSHGDAELIAAVRWGRREEFAAFEWQGEPPDAQSAETFAQCRLNHELRHKEPHRTLLEYYTRLIELRQTLPGLSARNRPHRQVHALENEVVLQVRGAGGDEALIFTNFNSDVSSIAPDLPAGNWRRVLDSANAQWHGPGSTLPDRMQSGGELRLTLQPQSIALFERTT